MDFRYKKAYLKRFDRFPRQDKELIVAADRQIRDYYTLRSAPYGLRTRKLYEEGKTRIFEARVSDRVRILWVEAEDLISFALVGSHDEVKNYIKALG